MKMNLEKMITAQENLDNAIREEKGLQGKDLVANTFVALQVELAEFANECRWFKHWSENQEPRDYVPNSDDVCEECGGQPIFYDDNKNIVGQCKYCDGCGVHFYNPLLEEFVDGIHFFLSLAIQKDWKDTLYVYEEQLDPEEWTGNITGYYLEMIHFLNLAYIKKYSKEQETFSQTTFGLPANQFDFRMAWICFLNIGINGFGLDSYEIEQAYFDKNKINHERQKRGY